MFNIVSCLCGVKTMMNLLRCLLDCLRLSMSFVIALIMLDLLDASVV